MRLDPVVVQLTYVHVLSSYFNNYRGSRKFFYPSKGPKNVNAMKKNHQDPRYYYSAVCITRSLRVNRIIVTKRKKKKNEPKIPLFHGPVVKAKDVAN